MISPPAFIALDAEMFSNCFKKTGVLWSCGDCELPQDWDCLVLDAILSAEHGAWYTEGDRCTFTKGIAEGKGQALNPDLLNSRI